MATRITMGSIMGEQSQVHEVTEEVDSVVLDVNLALQQNSRFVAVTRASDGKQFGVVAKDIANIEAI